MTRRRPSSQSNRSSNRWANRHRLQHQRRQNRHALLESLENRQLLAGPDLIGVQPNQGSLLFESPVLSSDPSPQQLDVLNVSPRELVFRFDDDTQLDPDTLSAIRITRAGADGVFESASAITDFGTDGRVVFEFRAQQSGTAGNGITVTLTSSSRAGSSQPIVTVDGRNITLNLNSNPQRPTRAQDITNALQANEQADALIQAIQVSGPSLGVVGTSLSGTSTLTLQGANAAQAVTDFGTGGEVQVRLVSQLPGAEGRGTHLQIEQRNFGGEANPVVVVNGNSIRVQLNSAPGFETTAAEFINAINNNPDAAEVVSASLQQGNLDTVIGDQPTSYSPLTLTGVSDVVLEPGFVGLGDSAREVVFRFAEPLPDDTYQVDILGSGPLALANVDGEKFQDGVGLTRKFEINLGPKVVAVVPEPVRRASNGAISPAPGIVEVHFNDDDLDFASASDRRFYQLIFTADTASNADDTIVRPQSVTYNAITNIATLDFGRPLSRIPDVANAGQFLEGAARLRVGTAENLPQAPTEISIPTGVEPGDSLATAYDLNNQWTVGSSTTQSARLTGEIFNTSTFDLDLPGPDVPGTRNIRPEDPSRLDRVVPLDYVRNAADSVNGISVIQYDFRASFAGDDPNSSGIDNDRTYFNIISEQQKQRVREVLQLFSEYLGVNFVEVEGSPTAPAFFSIAVGDLYGGDPSVDSADGGLAVVTRDTNSDGLDDLAVLDFQDFDESIDDQFGEEFFRGAMFAVGQLLGYGYADDLPQPVSQSTDFIFTPGTDNEAAFPSVADIVHGQYLYRPDSTDIDLYQFTLDSPGQLSVETIAERLGSASLLDTALQLYRVGADGSYEQIAGNGDYFSNDSLIELDVDAGTYVLGVSAQGNTEYDPGIAGTGFGGLSEGEYELRLDFRPQTVTSITDTTGVTLDGDADNRPGGVFNFWFVPSDPNNTIYVDKAVGAMSGNQLGTVGNPYREIDQAIAAANPGDTIRVLGNGGVDGRLETAEDNLSYQIGFSNNGLPLSDGSSLNLPQGVRMVIDSAAILKMSRSRIGVGSVSPAIDASDSALQVLGTPTIIGSNGLPVRDVTGALVPGSVIITSINDDTVGTANQSGFTPEARPGDWGGIDFRGDLDAADELRRNREDEGVFLNHVQFADLRFGGGAVSVGGNQVPVSPIEMAMTRASVINSRITRSADAAIAATPETFAETRFTDPRFQAGGTFTPDYTRIGPDIHGNTVVENSINGLFIRVGTATGEAVRSIDSASRFDDTDIVHVLTENLNIEGTPGGPILISSSPSSLLVRSSASPVGAVPAGTYVYRITNVNREGLESAASDPSVPVTLDSTGGVALSQLPTIRSGSNFLSRRLYRAAIDPSTGQPDEFRLVARLNASSTSYVDQAAAGTAPLLTTGASLQSRLDASLKIDPGTVLKLDGARIEARFGADLVAEGTPGVPVIFTSLNDQRYGTGGTFDTNNRAETAQLAAGDWGGLYIGQGASASLDNVVVAGAGGTTRVEGGFAAFNPIEVQQGTLRLANSRFESNADGIDDTAGTRVGRGANAPATVFVRAATPTIINNQFVEGRGPAMSFDLNSLSSAEVNDPGRSTGSLDQLDVVGNAGPLIQGNVLSDNETNGLQVRGGQLATAGVWDDVDIVHVVTESVEIPNQHILGGLRLQSDARGSLVVKFRNGQNESAGIVVGGSLLSAADQFRDIPDRIGGSLQVVGHADFPVVLTTLADDMSGAGFNLNGQPQMDTNNDGLQGEGGLPTGPEVNNGTLIDNDVNPTVPGFFEFQPAAGGEVANSGGFNSSAATTVRGLSQIFQQQQSLFDYGNFIDVGSDGGAVGLGTTTVTMPPTLTSDDRVVSEGTFQGANGEIVWHIEQFFEDGSTNLQSEITLTSGQALGDLRFINYYDPNIGTDSGDVLFTEGTPGTDDFRITILDGPEGIGFRQYGAFEPGEGLSGATYEGWIADDFPDLITAPEFNLPFTVNGTIDGTSVPTLNDPRYPTPNYGLGILTSAVAWQVDPNATSATITTNLEVIAEVFSGAAQPESGQWNGVTIREAASDRNVASVPESEPVRTSVFDTNSIPSRSQFLGELAPNEQSGDENRRLGFVVNGSVATRDDIDVYSFVAESGTEVWLDIDRTSNQLDTVVELINANGEVLALSNDSLLADSGLTQEPRVNPNTSVNPGAAQSLSTLSETPQQDTYSTNPKDAGMRLRLPGEAGTRNLYHVRVRSSNVPDAQAANAFENLIDSSEVGGGLTKGSYELQVRLRETDESAGTQINLSEVRFATNGVQIIGQPLHSPLLGEEYEQAGANDTRQDAQRLGYNGVNSDQTLSEAGPLQSDRLAKSIGGIIESGTDVDWYEFEIQYENLTRDGAAMYLSTVFDLDYADNFARSDMALYVFDSQGQLVLIGGDSNIADDLPDSPAANDTADLSAGSAGTGDPFIGAAELSEGTYYVAVSNQQQVPAPLDQFFNAGSSNPLLRLEPVDSVQRIAEDHIGSSGGGTAGEPVVPVLFDNESIVDYALDDVLLYVNTVNRLLLVNPFTGQTYGAVGNFGDEIRDVAFRANGELFAYTGFDGRAPSDTAWSYRRIDTSDASLSPALSVGAGMLTFDDSFEAVDDGILDRVSDDGLEVEAITIREFGGQEVGYFVGNRPVNYPGLDYVTNVLYDFDEETGLATGPNSNRSELNPGAGTSRREVGQINTVPAATAIDTQLGIRDATGVNAQGVQVPQMFDGDTFTLSTQSESVTFELDAGFTLIANTNSPVRDGDLVTVGGRTFEFNTGARLQIDEPNPVGMLSVGSTVTVAGASGQTATFEFVRFDSPQTGNIPISMIQADGTPRTAAAITAELAAEINDSVAGSGAEANGNEIFFAGDPSSISETGVGVEILGDSGLEDSDAVAVNVSETIGPEQLMRRLADAIRSHGISVSQEGIQLTVPGVSGVTVNSGSALSVTGAPGVATGNRPILLLPTDSAEVLGERIVNAIQAAGDEGDLTNVAAEAEGHSLRISGGIVDEVSGSFVAGGNGLGGRVTGIEIVGNDLYAVTNQGGMYRVTSGELNSNGNRQVGTYVDTATDLRGLNFTGLRAGPNSVQDGELGDLLFGTTANGDIYAFNTRGELQPVFAGGRSMISTGISGALGLDFSTLDYNLWHQTGRRGDDPGHGINALFNGTRGASSGGNSLAFTYEAGAFSSNYDSFVERPVAVDASGNLVNPRQDGTTLENSFNMPGGAKGVVQSNTFSLEGYSAADQPAMYFNYFLDNDGVDGLNPANNNGDQDALRVYVVTASGAEQLVATNNSARGGGSTDIQPLFDNTGTWRQARVPLGAFAGQSNLSLRIEFSSAGTTETGSPSIRTVAGSDLIEGEQLVIGGEVFEIDLAPTVSVPSGSELANLYTDPDAIATVTIDGHDFVLNDGDRAVGADQTSVDLLADMPAGTTLASLSAGQIADALAETIRQAPPPNPIIDGLNFSDPSDDASGVDAQNDLIYEATPLPYNGGNATLIGSGRIGGVDEFGNSVRAEDVDLLRLTVAPGTTISVDVDLNVNPDLDPGIRFFDEEGNPLAATVHAGQDRLQYTSTSGGTVFIGISGRGNESYDPRQPNSTQAGQVDSYTARIDVTLPLVIQTEGSIVELGGLTSVSTSPDELFHVASDTAITGTPVRVSRFMTAEEVARQLQLAVAGEFSGGDLTSIPTTGASVRLPALTIDDAGPFADESQRVGDGAGAGVVDGADDNNYEGVYLDDFIIGFAERGEIATSSNVVSGSFIPNERSGALTSDLLTGSYQVEIRDASEYVSSLTSSRFRTFDTNDRLAQSASITALPADQIRDGDTFSLFDGRSRVTFEFDLEESNTGVAPGNVRIPFSLRFEEPGSEQVDPVSGLPIAGTGVIRQNTAAEVADHIVEAINRDDVQSVIDVSALPSSGVDTPSDATINLFGEVAVENDGGALASVEVDEHRGDQNRERDAQGVILIENSRFLYNQNYGIDISHDVTTTVAGVETDSIVRYPRNLIELNSESLKPGVVVQSNVIAFNETGGIQVAGIDPSAGGSLSDPVPFERLINNTIIGGTVREGFETPAETFQGVLFEGGSISFADSVAAYEPGADGSSPASAYRNAANALGAPNLSGRGAEPTDGQSTVSLGLEGSLTLQFTDNLLTGSGDSQPDLIVFESGAVESVQVEISRDGTTFFNVGMLGGLTNQLDIDAAGFGREDRFSFVRLTDLRQGSTTGGPLGADIDAVGALSTTAAEIFTAGGTGLNVTGNAAPTVLNNVIANNLEAIDIAPASGLVLGGNTYYQNQSNVPAGVSTGQFSQVLSGSEPVFVSAAELVFSPAAGSSIIDSSIDSLQDRPSLVTVKNPLGLPPSPIIAPRLDVNGQLRMDDPNVETPSGLGERVFKDRGAADRGDLTGPRAVLLSPQAPGLGVGAGVVSVLGAAPQAFEIQLIDGLAPADVTPGTGVDDRSVSSNSVLLLKDNMPLVEGVDYRFGYNPSTNVIRLTPIAGVFQLDSTYVVRLVDASDAIIAASEGVSYTDGATLNVIDSVGQSTSFEYEAGIQLTLASTLAAAGQADGVTFEIFDGRNQLTFELDNDQDIDGTNIAVTIPASASANQIASALADAVNDSAGLDLTANVAGRTVQLLGGTPLSSATSDSALVTVSGSIGTEIGFGLRIPADGARPDEDLLDAQTFIIRRGSVNAATFEFDRDGTITTAGAIPVRISANSTLDQIADAIVRAVAGTSLGLVPENAGFGRVFLGGDANYSLDLSNSVLTQLGNPGSAATQPIVIPIDQTAIENAQIIADAIDAAGLAGINSSIVDSRVFLEGTGGISGTGAIDLVPIQDEVGNRLQSNQVSGRTELTVFVGSGYDFGDAPAPYVSLDVDGGPRHAVDPNFSLGQTITADSNAIVPNGDLDDGVTVPNVLQAGFASNFLVDITADSRDFYLDAWFDWNADGTFETVERFGSAGTGLPQVSPGSGNVLNISVPSDAVAGEVYARFRLSETAGLGVSEQAGSGEVEDYRLIVSGNPYQNPITAADVNDSGAVTPLDALQIINLLNRTGGADGRIDLSDSLFDPSMLGRATFPDVNGSGTVTAGDALSVINALNNASFSDASGERESLAMTYKPVAQGLLASGATVAGDALIADAVTSTTNGLVPPSNSVDRSRPTETTEAVEPAQAQAIDSVEQKTSIFDHAAVVDLDSIVDEIAADTASAKQQAEEISALDQLFANL